VKGVWKNFDEGARDLDSIRRAEIFRQRREKKKLQGPLGEKRTARNGGRATSCLAKIQEWNSRGRNKILENNDGGSDSTSGGKKKSGGNALLMSEEGS